VDWYSTLKDFAAPVAALCGAAAATYFARQQSNTAKRQAETAKRQAETAIDQLRFNLFEKRYASYDAIKGLIWHITAPPDIAKTSAVDEGLAAIGEAQFFFSPETCRWLETVRDDCQALIEQSAQPTPANAQDRAALRSKLFTHFRAMPERFRNELSFRQLTERPR
jgi:hypothetical protein